MCRTSEMAKGERTFTMQPLFAVGIERQVFRDVRVAALLFG
jgi:hypothetical protein